ncbi:MAG TPA: hypothetical protein VJ952_05980 [Opitutales bacterium]|nr:hypothetical protein [Opitutales bacterium]
MKKFYDKLLLALAVLALLGGALFYVLKSAGAEDLGAGPELSPADNPYEPVPIPDPTAETASWPEPGPQSSGPNWLYDVFTPPKIYIDKDGNFTAEPPKVIDPEEPFGIYLAEIERKPYRIQMQGYSGDREKPEEAVLFFFDVERQIRFFIREGQSNEESEVEVLDFRIEREVDADNNISVTAIATILDKRIDEEIELNDEEALLSPELSLVFLSEEDPDVRVELTLEPPISAVPFETPAGEYVLTQINLEDRSVTVEKKPTEESEAETRTLEATENIEPEDEQATEATEASEAAPNGEDDFNFVF